MKNTSYLLLNGYFTDKALVYSAIKHLIKDKLVLAGTVKKSITFFEKKGEIRNSPSYELSSVIHKDNKQYIKELLEKEYNPDFVCFTSILDESKNLDSFLVTETV